MLELFDKKRLHALKLAGSTPTLHFVLFFSSCFRVSSKFSHTRVCNPKHNYKYTSCPFKGARDMVLAWLCLTLALSEHGINARVKVAVGFGTFYKASYS